jgi:hypothetical protein
MQHTITLVAVSTKSLRLGNCVENNREEVCAASSSFKMIRTEDENWPTSARLVTRTAGATLLKEETGGSYSRFRRIRAKEDGYREAEAFISVGIHDSHFTWQLCHETLDHLKCYSSIAQGMDNVDPDVDGNQDAGSDSKDEEPTNA